MKTVETDFKTVIKDILNIMVERIIISQDMGELESLHRMLDKMNMITDLKIHE